MKFIVRALFILSIIAGTAFWLSYLPFDESTLLRPVPPSADWISVHENAAQRVFEWGDNPFARSLLQASGVELEEVDSLREDSTFLFLLNSLADHRTVLAHIPSRFSLNQPSWVLTSWLGGRATWFRWYLHLRPDVSLVHQGKHLGYDIWMIDPMEENQPVVYFSLCRGMLMASIDGSPELLKGMIQMTLSQIRYWDDIQNQLRPETLCGGMGATDRAWIEGSYWGLNEGIRIALDEVDGYSIRGRACANEKMQGLGVLSERWVQSALDRFSSADTIAWSMMPFQIFWDQLERFWLKESFVLPQEMLSKPVWLSLQTGGLSGRLLGVKIPSLTLAVEVDSEEQADKWVGSIMDVLNARFSLGLIPRKTLIDGRAATVIERSSNSPYGFLPDSNKVGYRVENGWLTVASYAEVLEPLAKRGGRDSISLAQTVFGGLGGTYTWFDIDSLSEKVSPLIRILKFRLMLKRSPEAEAQQENLNLAQTWLEVLRPFGEAFFSLYSEEDSTILTIQAGQP